MSFTNFTSGHAPSFGGEYLALIPSEKLRNTDKFDDSNLPGESQTTVSWPLPLSLHNGMSTQKKTQRARAIIFMPNLGLRVTRGFKATECFGTKLRR